MAPKIVRVLMSEAVRGTGAEGDPVRTVAELYTLDGLLIAVYDTQTGESRMYSEGLHRLGLKRRYEVPVVR